MEIDRLGSIMMRTFFTAAFVLFGVAVVEWLLSAGLNRTLLQQRYQPGRLMEFAAIALVFVIALLLRQIREELRKKGA